MNQIDAKLGQTRQNGGLRDLLPALGLLAAGLVALCAGTMATTTVPGQYIVVIPPELDAGAKLTLIAEAGGALIASGGFNNVLFAASDDPDFAETLQAAGAWIVLPAPAFLGCATDRLET